MLQVTGVDKTYRTPDGPLEVLRGAGLTLAPGGTLALTGESGSGKSTLVHAIAGLEPVDAGRITLFGTEVTGLDDAARAALRRDRIGLVFQQFNLIPSLTVARNIAFQARLAERDDPAWRAEVIRRLGLGALEERYPEQLSGGQQQRVAVARALAHRPDLVLADEPTGNLDPEAGDAVLDLILALVAEAGCMLILVTHNPRLAARMERSVKLHAGRLA